MKKILIFAVMMLVFSITFAWDNGVSFPDPNENSIQESSHGIAVDGNGRIWYGSFYATDSIYVANTGSYEACRNLKVFNPDGTLETIVKTFYPLDTTESYYGYEVDTFWNELRGLGTSPEGDVIVSVHDSWYVVNKDDFTTKLIVKQPFGDNTITKVATDSIGNFFVNAVAAGGQPIKAYDPSGNFIRDVVPGELISGYSRTVEVSPDGKEIYFINFYLGEGVIIFRSDEGIYGDYTSQIDTIHGLRAESAGWDPLGRLWFGASYLSSNIYTHYAHYAWDPISESLIDSIIPVVSIIEEKRRPIGIDFSKEGHIAYISYFVPYGANSNDIYKHTNFSNEPILINVQSKNYAVELTWSSVIETDGIYYIYRSTNNVDFNLIDQITGTPPDTTYTDVNVINGTEYFYKVSAKTNDLGESIFSNVLSTTPNASPVLSPISNKSTLEDTPLTFTLDASDPDNDDINYIIKINSNEITDSISENNLTLTPKKDWFGQSEVTVIALDYSKSDTAHFTLDVIPVNDQPICNPINTIVMENEILEIILTGSPGPTNEANQKLICQINTLPNSGYLTETIDGSKIIQDQLPYVLNGDKVYYAQTNRFEKDTFQIQVMDDGGTENGGIDVSDPQTVTISLNIPSNFCVKTNGPIEGGVTIINDNAIYAAASEDGVYRFNSEGNIVYTLNVNGNIKSSTTITPDHKVYIASTDYNLYSFNANGLNNTGWPVSLGAQATASVATDTYGNVYIGTSNGIFQAISPEGSVLWGYNVGAAVYASSAISLDNILFVINENGRIFAIDLNNINPDYVQYEWLYELGEQVISSPALDNQGNIYITTLTGNIYKLFAGSDQAEYVWNYSVSAPISSSPIIGSDYTAYFGSENGYFYAIKQNGDLKWERDLNYPIRSTAALAEYGIDNDRLYIGTDGGYLFALSLSDGSVLWKHKTKNSIRCPILYSDNFVYFGTISGDIVSIADSVKISKFKKNADVNPQWPTFQRNNARTGMFESITNIDDNKKIPNSYSLSQNYPNPFNPTTAIEYALPEQSNVKLIIYDIKGNTVKHWNYINQNAGYYSVIWNGTNSSGSQVSTGIYFYRIIAGDFTQTKKMVFMK